MRRASQTWSESKATPSPPLPSLVPSTLKNMLDVSGFSPLLGLTSGRAGGQEGGPPLFLKVSGMEAKQNRRARECEPGIPTIRLGAAREG